MKFVRFSLVLKRLLVTGLLFFFSSVYAARPFVTDDARLTTAGSCQLESWIRSYKNSTEQWILPACNPFGRLELTLGGGKINSVESQGSHDLIAQGKVLFKPLKVNGYGYGLAAGSVSHPSPNPGPNQFGNRYIYVPVSMSFLDDQVVLHTNFGMLKDKASADLVRTYGFGIEFKISSRYLGVAEIYGDNRNRPYMQSGLRYSVIPDLFQVDATIGLQHSGNSESRFVSIGLRYTPDKLPSFF